jgi:hypothetical protein
MKRQHQNTFKYNPLKHGETQFEPSITVPDDSYTIKDILTRFTRGIDPMLTRLGEYEKEQNSDLNETEFELNPIRQIEDLSDISELESFLKRTEENKKILIGRIKEQKKLAEEKLAEEKLQEANKLAT